MPRLQLVLDTNVLVSGLAYPASIPGRILSTCRQGGADLVLSRYILDEMRRVLPRLQRIPMSAEELGKLVDAFLFLAEVLDPDQLEHPRLRDAADQQVLATLRASHADYLITGDKDLLALADEFPIVTPAQFWNRHGI